MTILMLALATTLAPAAEPWRWDGARCEDESALDRPSLLAALELELGAPTPAAVSELHIVWPCADDVTVRLRATRIGARVESQVDLTRTPAHLRDRMVALVARELLRNARTVALLEPEPYLEVPAPELQLGLRVAASTRLFISGPGTLFGGAIEWSWRWLRLGLGVHGTGNDVPEAALGGLLARLELGAMPFRWEQGAWRAGLGAFLEGGVVATWSRAKLAGFEGTSTVAPLGGIGLRSEVGVAFAKRWPVTLSLDAGYDIGNRVFVFGHPVLYLHGFFADVRIGFSF